MMATLLTLTPSEVRRLAILAQRLAGPQPQPDADGIMQIMRAINCVQIDPIRAVERTDRLVLWSRLGVYDPAIFDRLRFEDFALFEYWAHAASIVLTEDYPIHSHWMRRQFRHHARVQAWIDANPALKEHILSRLEASDHPLDTADFDDLSEVPWKSTGGWNNERNVSMMLTFLWERGDLLIAARKGARRLWHLPEHYLPDWTPRAVLTEAEVVARTVDRALTSLGVATSKQIRWHFTRQRYPGLAAALQSLTADGVIQPVRIVDNGDEWPGDWMLHNRWLPALEALRRGEWEPRTVLLSPFDNLICDRDRTELLWDFYYRIEIYVPKAKRQFGYYVLPILHGDRLIGRIDSRMDRKAGIYRVHRIYWEPDIEISDATRDAVQATIENLGQFVGASGVEIGEA